MYSFDKIFATLNTELILEGGTALGQDIIRVITVRWILKTHLNALNTSVELSKLSF